MFFRFPAPRTLLNAGFSLLVHATAVADSRVALLSAATASYASSASFTVTLETPTAANYQWYKDGAPLVAAQSPTLEFPIVDTAHAGAYHVVVSNEAGTAISRPAGLSVITQPELVASLLTDQVVAPDGNLTLRTSVAGKNLTYRWFYNGVELRRQNGATLSLQKVTAANAGTYMVKISNKAGLVAVSVGIVRVESP